MNKNIPFFAFAGFGILIVAIILLSSTFLTIEPGQRGILFKQFDGGLDKETIYGQGFHIIAPWNRMIIYDVREQIKVEQMDVLSSDGLPIQVDMSVRYHPTANKIGYLHDEIGQDYANKIVKDVLRAATREVIGKYTPEQIYSVKRDSVRLGIAQKVGKKLSKKHITMQMVNMRSIKLPKMIEDAIQTKLVQEQEKEQYEFRIAKESKEAERKTIEAEGIRAFQEIVSQGISKDYLKWKGIEATQELAKSPNSKVIVIGSGSDGLPIILGGDN